MKVALTFDDGPNPPRTDQVIDILNSKGARGSFFVLGKWAERWPQALERIIRNGQVVGNHSYMHHAHVGDFDRAEAAIGNVIGRPTQFVRAHYFNHFTLIDSPYAMSKAVKNIDSDVNPADWNKTDPQAIIDAVLNHPQLAGGSVIDLHDSTESDDDAIRLARPIPMIEALPAMIDGLYARGYKLVGLDEMEFVDPIEWQADGRGLFASPEMQTIVSRR
jgi:peptidoglycan/xylan/chitin deacetylase (PgdA/CDA1 family)